MSAATRSSSRSTPRRRGSSSPSGRPMATMLAEASVAGRLPPRRDAPAAPSSGSSASSGVRPRADRRDRRRHRARRVHRAARRDRDRQGARPRPRPCRSSASRRRARCSRRPRRPGRRGRRRALLLPAGPSDRLLVRRRRAGRAAARRDGPELEPADRLVAVDLADRAPPRRRRARARRPAPGSAPRCCRSGRQRLAPRRRRRPRHARARLRDAAARGPRRRRGGRMVARPP